MNEWLTYREAAAKVGRSKRALQRWHRKGMRMRLDDRGRKIVNEVELYAWYRKALAAWPAHQYRMRKIMRDTPNEQKN